MNAIDWLYSLDVGDTLYVMRDGYEESMEVLDKAHKRGDRHYVNTKRPFLKAIKSIYVLEKDTQGIYYPWSMKHSSSWNDHNMWKVVKKS